MGNAATPAITDMAAQGAQIDANFTVSDRIAWAFAPHEQSTPNMTVRLEAGALFNGSAVTERAAQNTGAITAPSSNPRIDRIVVDRASGDLSVVTGAESGSPTPPAIPEGKVPVAQVALAVATTAITNDMITDERVLNALGLGSIAFQNANNVSITGGTISNLSEPLAVEDGGTGVTSLEELAGEMGLGTMAFQDADNVEITGGAITGITDLAVADGGTGASDAAGARANLGLGTMATQNANGVSIIGGSINGITDLAVADGGTGTSSLTANAVLLGNGTSAIGTVSGLGTIGQVLTSNGSGNPPTWQAAGGGYAKIVTKTASSSASLNFTEFNPDLYKSYAFILEGLSPATDNVELIAHVSIDGGSSYRTSSGDYAYSNAGRVDDGNTMGTNSTSATRIVMTGSTANSQAVGNGTNEKITGRILLINPAAGNRVYLDADTQWQNLNGNFMSAHGGGIYKGTNDDVNAIQFLFSSGNISSGSITMYGMAV